MLASLLVLIGILALVGMTVSAADEEAPTVRGPVDRPGADVVWFANVEYTLDATGSTDDTGIISYQWDIYDPAAVMTTVTSFTPTAKFTPTEYGIHKVISWAFDAAGNKGHYVWAMDVAEAISGSTIKDTSVSYDHSVAVRQGKLTYENTDIEVTGGREAEFGAGGGGESPMSEDVTVKGGPFAGYWQSYYGDPYYGEIVRDTKVKLTGSASISVTGGSYRYGAEYVFDNDVDLTKYNSFVFWYRGLTSQQPYPYQYYLYMYSGGNSQSYSGYAYTYGFYYPGPNQQYGGWMGITYSLDLNNVGYYGSYNFDLAACSGYWLYCYAYTYSDEWFDCIYFAKETYGDNITDSPNPGGDWAGYWSTSSGSVSSSSTRYVGSSSVMFSSASGYRYLTYNFNQPVDLSSFNALRIFSWLPNYYYCQLRSIYFYSTSGAGYFDQYSSNYFHYYATYNYNRWFLKSVGFDKTFYTSKSMDWTQVTTMELYMYFPGSSTFNLDGLEFYKSQTASGGGTPVLSEEIPHGIYAIENGQLTLDNVRFTSPSPMGAFVRCDNDLYVKDSTFSGLWGTSHSSIQTTSQSYGGILAFNANNCTLDGVTITKATSSGIYVENSNINAKNLDLSGYASQYTGAAGLIISQVDTAYGYKNKVEVSKSKFYNSIGGTGISVISQNSLGAASINIEDIVAHGNGMDGMSIEVIGRTGNLSVNVRDSSFYLNDGAGFAFYAHDSAPAANTRVRFEVSGCDAYDNSAYGVLFQVKKAVVGATGTLTDFDIYNNEADGIGIDLTSFAGDLTLNFKGVRSYENLANGMYIKQYQTNFKNIDGVTVMAEGWLNLNMEDSSFNNNEASGVNMYPYAYGDYSNINRPKVNERITATRVNFVRNALYGYTIYPSSYGYYGCRDENLYFYDCTFSENSRAGFYSYCYFYGYLYYGGVYAYEKVNFYNCTFTYNQFGYQGYFPQYYCYGNEIFVTAKGCTFQDNDVEAVRVTGDWNSYGGYTYLYGAEYHFEDSLLDGFVRIDVVGLYDQYYGKKPNFAGAYFENVTYTNDRPMYIRFSNYYYSYNMPTEMTVVYKDVTHTSPSTGDGLHVEMYGSTVLEARVEVSNMKFDGPLGDGVQVYMKTTVPSTSYRRQIIARIVLTDVEILNPMEKGLFVEMAHSLPVGAISKGTYSLTRVTIKGANEAVRTHNMDGEILQCKFTNTKQENVYTRFGVIDIYESEIGPISTTNLVVDEKGAIRLWFSMRVKVVWAGTDEFIKGASVEIKDNSWNIIGINTINSDEGVLFMNLNSYTVLPEGIFTKNPYIITVDYLGIIKEIRAQVEKNTEVTIGLTDDIAPRLTIETPKDGQEQRERDVTVKGTAYDKHTGLDKVVVSTDDEEWFEATLGDDGFTYTYELTDLPEGLSIIWVRSYDNAGNHKEVAVTVLVDSTPPSLDIITPTNGMKTNKRALEIVGTTDVGANVYINDRPIETQYTLISYQLILAEGPNAVKITAVDYLGNVVEVLRYVTLDTQAPYIAMVTQSGTVNTEKVTLVGLTEPTDVTILVAGKKVPVDTEGRFTTTVTLKNGANKVEVYGVDGVGNERIITLAMTLDQSVPWVRLVEPSGEVSTMNDIRVSGFVELGSTVFVNDREVDVSFGHFETTVSAQEGDVELRIVAVDEAGNEAIITRMLRVDTVAPAVEVLFPTDGYVTNMQTIEVMGSIALDDERASDIRYIELYINDVPRLFNFLTGTFTQDVMLEEGVNRIEVRVVDPVGNEARDVRTVMLDSQAPYLSVSVGNVRNDPNWNEPVSLSNFVFVSGFTEVGGALTINGVAVDVDPETGSFNYSLDLPEPSGGLRISTTTVHVEATDAAGNMAMQEQDVNRIQVVEAAKEGANTAQWLVLLLALVIFGLSFAGALSYQRIQAQEEIIEALEARPQIAATPGGKAVSPPPSRPVRGGRTRHKPEGKDEVVIDLDKKGGE